MCMHTNNRSNALAKKAILYLAVSHVSFVVSVSTFLSSIFINDHEVTDVPVNAFNKKLLQTTCGITLFNSGFLLGRALATMKESVNAANEEQRQTEAHRLA